MNEEKQKTSNLCYETEVLKEVKEFIKKEILGTHFCSHLTTGVS